MDIKTIIKNNTVIFSHYRKGFAYYNVTIENVSYVFPVNLQDIGDATLYNADKAILFMRYIKKALEENTFIKI